MVANYWEAALYLKNRNESDYTFTFFLSSSLAFAQRDALVFFTDKARVNTYLASPQTMLTKKALDRKEQHGTPLDARDVPVNEIYISALKTATVFKFLQNQNG